MSLVSARTGNVIQMRLRISHAIIVEPAENNYWVWRLYRWKGQPLGTRCEYGSRELVIDSARDYSQRTGLPAFYRAAVGDVPIPMKRGGRRTPR
ncbi:hypothetical protein EWE75_23710 [Sphingomonas populi]|uniref:Uncharacterized protein n=1 Tax=Sphingomonas populi TaxID=2484750 RepID=A0A4Q6XRG0_9SPHN|nr:hypothetical protein [Sphingomonas populi]RZF59077.1 hypothetical protein EWE75_23710 [Sphingomonas populi]